MSHSYPVTIYSHIDRMERNHFWFLARAKLIRLVTSRFIDISKRRSFLDVGCGTGTLLLVFKTLGFSVTGIDINSRALLYAKKKIDVPLIRSSLCSYEKTNKYDVIGLFDVLEHQHNDNKFLMSCNRLLKKGGYLLINVPAHHWLWTELDTFWGHVRRYEKQELKEKLRIVGFELIFSNYWNVFLLPWYIAWRWMFPLSKKKYNINHYFKAPAWPVNIFCTIMLYIERIFFFSISFPFGSSLMAVAKKI